jgi:hypothetical protein
MVLPGRTADRVLEYVRRARQETARKRKWCGMTAGRAARAEGVIIIRSCQFRSRSLFCLFAICGPCNTVLVIHKKLIFGGRTKQKQIKRR